jgi:pimeloyl-ACP methyl ester carboxylesterase
MGLTQPPKQAKTTRVFFRLVFLVLLVAAAGVAIWNASTEQSVDLLERTTIGSLGLDPTTLVTVGDLEIRVVDLSAAPAPVILLHDVDVAGSVIFDQLVPLVEGNFRPVTFDLPGFGLSQRMTQPGTHHTVAAMAGVLADVIADRYGAPVVVVGVGLGGKVAAETAVRRPDLVRGLVMVDVDFWQVDGWRQRVQRLPWIGHSMTYTYETSGRLATRTWAPNCDEGGWCPTPQQVANRNVTATIAGSTDSINAFYKTPAASLVPSDLAEIETPVAYVWSLRGDVPRESVERIKAAIPHAVITDVDVWKTHLEAPEEIMNAVRVVAGA